MKKALCTLFLCFILGCAPDMTWDIYRFDGISGFAATMTSQTVNKEECQCKGTGKVSTDGKIDLPCQCGANCKCKRVEDKTVQALYFGTKSCAPCRQIKNKTFPTLEKAGWKIDSKGECNIVLMDESTFEKYKIEAVPTFIYLADGKEVGRSTGYISANDLGNKINSLK